MSEFSALAFCVKCNKRTQHLFSGSGKKCCCLVCEEEGSFDGEISEGDLIWHD